MIRLCCTLLAVALLCSSVGAAGWKPIRIGGGGWVTGLGMSDDAVTKVCRADAFGAYVRGATESEWKQIITDSRMPASHVVPDAEDGCFEIVVAPSDSSIIYMMYSGEMFKSTDAGASFVYQSGFGDRTMNANDGYRMWGEKMAVDPEDPDHVLAGTQAEGMFRTTDGGTNWSNVAALGTPTSSGVTGIVFDRTSGTTSGRQSTAWAVSHGNGVYRTTDGGATWAVVSGGPTQASHADCSQTDGTYWVVSGDDNFAVANIHRYISSWSTLNTGGNPGQWHAVFTDPHNDDRVLFSNGGSSLIQTKNNGTSFDTNINEGSASRTSAEIPWLAWTTEDYMSVGDMMIDPATADKIWFSEGIGVWTTSDVTYTSTPSAATWVSDSKGIEELVALMVMKPEGGSDLILSAMDRPLFVISDPDVFPSTHGPNLDNAIIHGFGTDYDASNSDNLVAIVNYESGKEESGYSTNGGTTWTQFSAVPGAWDDGYGGSIAVSTGDLDNIVWCPSRTQVAGNQPYYTTNRGVSWTKITMPSVTDDNTFETGWGISHLDWYVNRQIVAADRVASNTFYMLHHDRGIYRSTDSGANWTRMVSTLPGNFGDNAKWHAKLQSVPDNQSHLWLGYGRLDGDPLGGFFRSTNGGTTWTQISNVLEVWAFGFGKAAPGNSYPTIFIYGWVSDVLGVWQSDDEGTTWTSLGAYPLGILDPVTTLSGDMAAYGRLYVGMGASGWAYYDPSTYGDPGIKRRGHMGSIVLP